MKTLVTLAAVLFLAMSIRSADAKDYSDVMDAVSENTKISAPAIEKLRELGPKGVERLQEWREVAPDAGFDSPEYLKRLDEVIDTVGGARYCNQTGLFWHTDLELAKKQALAEEKPILSLHMMGKLTDEFSCANSRFFRSTLYANEEIAAVMKEDYVLHWHSVRPVPKVTIDFGDGRKLERTLTGNSAHYLLTANGMPFDALPGLYAPARFKTFLTTGVAVHGSLKPFGAENHAQFIRGYHERMLRNLADAWQRDVTTIDTQKKLAEIKAAGGDTGEHPTALAAGRLAIGKGMIEIPLLAAITGRIEKLETDTDESLWLEIARLHTDEVEFDAASVAMIRSHAPTAKAAGDRTVSKKRVEDPILKMIRTLKQSVALDTVRNEYQLRSKIHQWFAEGDDDVTDIAALNERVYAELFLTPSSDPWIGLAPTDVYTALPGAGIVE